MNNLKQLSLNLCLKDIACFDNFFVGKNEQLVRFLSGLYQTNRENFVYFWGSASSGKSHLLSSLCQSFNEHGLSSAYLPLEDHAQLTPKMLEDLENLDLLCIDDLNLIANDLLWEEKIFHCFNKIRGNGKSLVITASVSPQALSLALPDLKSRMTSGLIFALHSLDDKEKTQALQLRARVRGLELSDSTAQFLLSHYNRDTKNLFTTLDLLDKEALAHKRKLTIPFVKDILGS